MAWAKFAPARHSPAQLHEARSRTLSSSLLEMDKPWHTSASYRRWSGRSTCRISSSGLFRPGTSALRKGTIEHSWSSRCSAASASFAPLRPASSLWRRRDRLERRSGLRNAYRLAARSARSHGAGWFPDESSIPRGGYRIQRRPVRKTDIQCNANSQCRRHARSTNSSSLGLELSDSICRLFCLGYANGTDLKLGDVRYGIDGANRQVVGGTVKRPVISNEDRVRPDGFHDLSPNDNAPAPAFYFNEVAFVDGQLFRQSGMHLAQRLRILVQQSADTARLRAGEEVRHYPSGGEDDGILVVRHLGGRAPLDGYEVRLAIGVSELSTLIEARCAGVADLRTWPEDSIALVNQLPSHPVIVRDTALGSDTQFLKDISR